MNEVKMKRIKELAEALKKKVRSLRDFFNSFLNIIAFYSKTPQ
jgi:hypothetical protein